MVNWVAYILIGFLGPMLIGLVTKVLSVVLVWVLYRFLLSRSNVLIDFMLSKIGDIDLSEATLNFVGASAYLAEKLQLVECVTLAISFAIMAFVLRSIPFK